MKFRKNLFFCVPALLLAVLTFSGCASTLRDALFPKQEVPTRYFVLSSSIQDVPEDASLPKVFFTRVDIPAYLDIPQIVTRYGNEIAKNEKCRWGEPLARGLARELALRCAKNLYDQGVSGKQPMIAVAFDRFDGTLNGNVEISAAYTIFRPTKSGHPDATHIGSKIFKQQIPVGAPNDYDAYVVALNAALEAFAQELAAETAEFLNAKGN